MAPMRHARSELIRTFSTGAPSVDIVDPIYICTFPSCCETTSASVDHKIVHHPYWQGLVRRWLDAVVRGFAGRLKPSLRESMDGRGRVDIEMRPRSMTENGYRSATCAKRLPKLTDLGMRT